MTKRYPFQVIREWVERDFVTKGTKFHLLPVAHWETDASFQTYFKIQIVGEEVSSSNIFEALYDKRQGKMFYSAYENMGLEPPQGEQ
jgi:hypothetical protein